MLEVGLTGGIGSGKSTVAGVLRDLGAAVVDADAVAREVVEPGTPVLAAIARRFGDALVRSDGTLDRAGLAALVFPDPAALADLDRITGPAITARVRQLRAAVDPGAVSVYDMPLLVERGLWVHEHLTVVVGADAATRVRRLVGRGLDEADARHRIARQATDDERRAAADIWVDNDGDLATTTEQVRALWTQRLVPYNDNLVLGRRSHRPDVDAVVDPDPTWPGEGARVVARLADALGDRALRVDHVGSTSVPGLPAKDVVDVQVAVRALADADDEGFVDALRRRGYVAVPGVHRDTPHPAGADSTDWGKRFFAGMDPGRVVNVHVREIGSPAYYFALQFRDWLRSDAAAREDYAALKRTLLARVGGRTDAYVEAKEPWFEEAYARVAQWARSDPARTSEYAPPAR